MNSNTTLVKVKFSSSIAPSGIILNSNTTLVKVKCLYYSIKP